MALTADQLSDMQADLGISNSQAVFTDTELNRLYARAESSYELAVTMAFRQLMADAAKFNDYTAGQSSERKSQVFDHIKAMCEWWTKEAGLGGLVPLSAGTIIQDFQEPG
jgi:hypothetical protein